MKYILIFTIKGNKIFVFMISKYPFVILTYVTKQFLYLLGCKLDKKALAKLMFFQLLFKNILVLKKRRLFSLTFDLVCIRYYLLCFCLSD